MIADAKASGTSPSSTAVSSKPARRREPERERQRVPEHERQRAEPGAPDNPAQLPPRRHRPHARERARHDHQPADEAQREIEKLGAVDEIENARQDIAASVAAKDRRDLGGAEQQRRQVDQRQQVAPAVAARPAVGPLRKDEREVDEERRQEQHRHDVAPVEHPVEQIEPAAERERQHAEERDAQPEEVQRRLILRPAQPHAGADEQREQPDARERQIQPVRARRDTCHLHGEEIGVSLPHDDVFEPRAGCRGVQRLDDVIGAQHRLLVDAEEHVARLDAGAAGG